LLEKENMKLNNYKIWFLLIILGGFMNMVSGQDGIDTALFKELKVKKMWVYVKLPILPTKSLNDSCKVEVYEFDSLQRIRYQLNNVSCYGWSGSTENFNKYDAKSRLMHSKQIMEGAETNVYYFYNDKNDAIRILQNRPDQPDSFVTINRYVYNKMGKPKTVNVFNIIGLDTAKYILNYDYDSANNIKTIWTYSGDMQLIQKETFDITPISKKLLEFSTEVVLPKRTFTRGWNYYNFDAQLFRTQYSNNTWTEFVYSENGLLDQSLSYNMEGKLNAWKTYYYEFYESQ